jgi:hypothetical protein
MQLACSTATSRAAWRAVLGGLQGAPYGPTDISNKVTADQCDAQLGEFAAALGERTCECGPQQYGAACCGNGCTQSFGNCVFPNHTAWSCFVGDGKGGLGLCNSLVASIGGQGVLCCRGFPANAH